MQPDTPKRIAERFLKLLGLPVDVSKDVPLNSIHNPTVVLAAQVLFLGILRRYTNYLENLLMMSASEVRLFTKLLIQLIVARLTATPQLSAAALSHTDTRLIEFVKYLAEKHNFFMLVPEFPPTNATFMDTFYVRFLPGWRVTTPLGYMIHEAFYANLPRPTYDQIVSNKRFDGSTYEMETPFPSHRMETDPEATTNSRCITLTQKSVPSGHSRHLMEWWMREIRPDMLTDSFVLDLDEPSLAEHSGALVVYDDNYANSSFYTQELIFDATVLNMKPDTAAATVDRIRGVLEAVGFSGGFERLRRVTLILPSMSLADTEMWKDSTQKYGIMDGVTLKLMNYTYDYDPKLFMPSSFAMRSYFVVTHDVRFIAETAIKFAFNHVCIAVFVVADDQEFSVKRLPTNVTATPVAGLMDAAYDFDISMPKTARNVRGERRVRVYILRRAQFSLAKAKFIPVVEALHEFWNTLPEFQKSMPIGVLGSGIVEAGVFQFIVADMCTHGFPKETSMFQNQLERCQLNVSEMIRDAITDMIKFLKTTGDSATLVKP